MNLVDTVASASFLPQPPNVVILGLNYNTWLELKHLHFFFLSVKVSVLDGGAFCIENTLSQSHPFKWSEGQWRHLWLTDGKLFPK